MARVNTKTVVGLGLFTAIVVILQLFGSTIRFGPFSISLVLIPVVVGAALYGAASGAWLGLAFGLTVFLSGDAAAFLAVDPLGTVLTVLIKGVAAGLAAGILYKEIAKENQWIAVIVSALVCPIVNTGLFLIGCRLFFWETVVGWSMEMGFGADVVAYLFLGLVGGNFLFELGANIVLSPLILRLISLGNTRIR